MGIMAHELRTPLATVALIGDAMRNAAPSVSDMGSSQKLEQLATRLHGLVHSMNHQIDTQIANARLQQLPGQGEHLSARELLSETIANYPYRSARERECVELIVRKDFVFISSSSVFSQVIDNLLKNALHALAAKGRPPRSGDLIIEAGTLQGCGYIRVVDKGTGIEPSLQLRIFEPFFSTEKGTGHGLGLAFCQRVVKSAGGSIRVQSEPGRGAAFTIDLPLVHQGVFKK